MGIRALALVLPALTGCVATSIAETAPKCTDGNPYERATMHADLVALASKELDGRAPGFPGDALARKHITERLTCLGLAPVTQPFTAQNGKETANVYAVLKGTDADVGDQIILVAAHHDHLGSGHLGANDNASGVSAMLAVAHDMIARGAPKRTIVFAAFGDEETGMTGSYYFAAHMPADVPMDKLVQVINLDMVGSHNSRGYVAAMGTLKNLAATKHLAKLVGKYPKISVGTGGIARGSDFEPFCKQRVPYVFFWTPDARCYHEKCDTIERLDEKHMVDIAALAGDLTRSLADSDADLAAAQKRLGCGVSYPRR